MNPGAGNRQDNRQRGNAAQLLEKYKGLARDLQMQGDRVQTEYYLQFADHYYRILNENRARFEEQRRQRGESYDGGYDEEESDEMEVAATSEPREPRDRPPVEDQETREAESRRDDPRRQGNGEFRGRRDRGRPRDEYEQYGERADEDRNDERIAADILPPSIGASGGDEAEESEPPARAPRRRGRRPRDDGDEIAPAA